MPISGDDSLTGVISLNPAPALAAMAKVQAGASKFAANLSNRMRAAGQSMKSVGASIGIVGGAMAGAATLVARSSFDIQKSLGELKSLYVDLGQEGAQRAAKEIQDAALEMSTAFAGVTATDIINGAYDIRSALSDLSATAVADLSKMAATTAKATKSTASQISDLFTQLQASYGEVSGLEAPEFGEQFSGVIAQAVKQFKLTGPKISEFWENAGSSAFNAGRRFEETIAIAGTLGQVIGGAEAGTALRFLDQQAGNVEKKFRQLAKTNAAFGEISFIAESGRIKEMPQLLAEVEKAIQAVSAGYQGATGAQAAAILLTELFGARGRKVYDILKTQVNNVVEGEKALVKAREGGLATAQQMAEIMDDTFGNQTQLAMQKVGTIIDRISLAIGETFKPMIKSMNQYLDGTLEWIQQNEEIAATIGTVVAAIGAMGAALAATGAALYAGGIAVSGFATGAAALNALFSGASGLIALAAGATAKIVALNKAFSATAILAKYHAILAAITTAFNALKAVATGAAIKSLIAVGPALVAGWLPVIAPVAAVAAALASVGYAAYTIYKYYKDSRYIKETQEETWKLEKATRAYQQQLENLYATQERHGSSRTEAVALEMITEEIKQYKRLGKTDDQIRKQIESNIDSLSKYRQAKWSEDSAFTEGQFRERQAERKTMLEAYKTALDEELIAKTKTEKQKTQIAKEEADKQREINEQLINQFKSLQEQYQQQLESYRKQEFQQAEESTFEKILNDSAADARKWTQDLLSGTLSRMQETREQIKQLQAKLGETPTEQGLAKFKDLMKTIRTLEESERRYEGFLRRAERAEEFRAKKLSKGSNEFKNDTQKAGEHIKQMAEKVRDLCPARELEKTMITAAGGFAKVSAGIQAGQAQVAANAQAASAGTAAFAGQVGVAGTPPVAATAERPGSTGPEGEPVDSLALKAAEKNVTVTEKGIVITAEGFQAILARLNNLAAPLNDIQETVTRIMQQPAIGT